MGDIRQEVTDRVIAAMEKGVRWTAGWHRAQPNHNALTGNPYRGINRLLLAMSDLADPRWLTFRQAEQQGYKVKKGEHGCRIIKLVEVSPGKRVGGEDAEVLGEDAKGKLVLKAYTVFNASQIEGMPALPERPNPVRPLESVQAIAAGMQSTGLTIRTAGAQPCYVPEQDLIRMPRESDFFSHEDYYLTLLHELAHATGSVKRQARPLLMARFGSMDYAREELRAELAATFVMSEVGFLPPEAQSRMEGHTAAYLSSWIQVLKEDKNEIFKAATEAQKIGDYLQQWKPEIRLDLENEQPHGKSNESITRRCSDTASGQQETFSLPRRMTV